MDIHAWYEEAQTPLLFSDLRILAGLFMALITLSSQDF
jgi:hypothetical protein